MRMPKSQMILILMVCLSLGFSLILPFFDNKANVEGFTRLTGITYGAFSTAVVEYGSYVYVAGYSAINRVRQYWKTNLTMKAQSAQYNDRITNLAIDSTGTYIYAGGRTAQTICQYWTSNMTKKAESIDTTEEIVSLAVDDTYVYCGNYNYELKQFWISNMTLKTTTSVASSPPNDIKCDNTYVYYDNGDVIYKAWKSNMTKKEQSASAGGEIFSIAINTDYIFVGGATTTVRQYWKSNFTYKGQTALFTDIRAVGLDNTYLYAGGTLSESVQQYWITNLTKKGDSAPLAGGNPVYAICSDGTNVYAAGSSAYLGVYAVEDSQDIMRKQASAVYSGSIYGVTDDTTYVYAAGKSTQKVYQYWKTNLTKKAESASYGGEIYALINDGTYLYFAGATTKKVYQCWISNMTKKAESAAYGNTINALTQDTTYVYAGGIGSSPNRVINQYWKSNMTKKASSADYGGIIQALTNDGTYVYADGATLQKVRQYWISNMTKKAESAAYGGTVYALANDGTYIYAGGATTLKVYQYWISNMTKKAESASYGGIINALETDGSSIYAVGATMQQIWVYSITDMSKTYEYSDYGMDGTTGTVRAITIDTDYLYIGGSSPSKVMQFYKNAPTSTRYWTNITAGYNSFSNISGYKTVLEGYNTFSHIPLWKNLSTGYNTFSSAKVWLNLSTGWNSFYNISSYWDLESGWNSFGNTSYMIIADIYPDNGDNVTLNDFTFSITVDHTLGETMNITWYKMVNGSWVAHGGSFIGVGNGTYYKDSAGWGIDLYNYSYTYRITVISSGGDTIDEVIVFTTMAFSAGWALEHIAFIIMALLWVFLLILGEWRDDPIYSVLCGGIGIGLIPAELAMFGINPYTIGLGLAWAVLNFYILILSLIFLVRTIKRKGRRTR